MFIKRFLAICFRVDQSNSNIWSNERLTLKSNEHQTSTAFKVLYTGNFCCDFSKEKIASENAPKTAGVNTPLLSIHIYLLLLAMAMSHQHICHNTMSSLVVLETSDGYPYISKRIESMLAWIKFSIMATVPISNYQNIPEYNGYVMYTHLYSKFVYNFLRLKTLNLRIKYLLYRYYKHH